MGQSASVSANIDFKIQTPQEFTNSDSLSDALLEFYANKQIDNGSDDLSCDVSIDSVNPNATYVEVELSSGRYQNCEFQLDLLIEFLMVKYSTSIEEFNSSGQVFAEDLCRYIEGDEFEEEE